MDLASIAFISTYKSWHCFTSVKLRKKKLPTKIQLQKSLAACAFAHAPTTI